jgi:hypothetical protein
MASRKLSNRHDDPWLARASLANANANDRHGRPRMDVELIAAHNPREQLNLTTVANVGQA